MRTRLILSLAALATLGACIHPVDSAHAPEFGRSLAAMVSAQTEPTQVGDEPPVGSGAVGASAVDAYANSPREPASTVNLNISTTSSD